LQPFQQTQLQPPFGQSVASLCHPWFTTTNVSYRFPIFETSATALCGTTGNVNKYKKYLCILDMMITITVTFSQKGFWTNKQTTIVATSNVRKDRNVNYQFITISAGSHKHTFLSYVGSLHLSYLCCKTNMAYTNLWNWLKWGFGNCFLALSLPMNI
jgi:hypothetical protein